MDNALFAILVVIGAFGLMAMIAAMVIMVIAWTSLVRGFRKHQEMVDGRLRARMSMVGRPLPHKDTVGSR